MTKDNAERQNINNQTFKPDETLESLEQSSNKLINTIYLVTKQSEMKKEQEATLQNGIQELLKNTEYLLESEMRKASTTKDDAKAMNGTMSNIRQYQDSNLDKLSAHDKHAQGLNDIFDTMAQQQKQDTNQTKTFDTPNEEQKGKINKVSPSKFKQFMTSIGNFFKKLWNGLKNVASKVGKAIAAVFRKISTAISGLFKGKGKQVDKIVKQQNSHDKSLDKQKKKIMNITKKKEGHIRMMDQKIQKRIENRLNREEEYNNKMQKMENQYAAIKKVKEKEIVEKSRVKDKLKATEMKLGSSVKHSSVREKNPSAQR